MPDDLRVERAFAKAKAAVEKRDTEQRRASSVQAETMDRADRREWSHKRLGDEHRWQETFGGGRKYGTRRFIYDPAQGAVVEQ